MHRHTISFKNAFYGIWTALTTQVNVRIHFLIASIVLVSAALLHLPLSSILDLILTISIVLMAEMANTAIEALADAVTTEQNPYIKVAKDVAAGGVLLTAILAIIVGLIIFVPYLKMGN